VVTENENRVWFSIGAGGAFLAVAAGAFGAHALRGRIPLESIIAFETAVRYQMYHALAILGICGSANFLRPRSRRLSMVSLLLGVVLFSGSLYAISLAGWRDVGFLTPIGGGFLLLGWLFAIGAAVAPGGVRVSHAPLESDREGKPENA